MATDLPSKWLTRQPARPITLDPAYAPALRLTAGFVGSQSNRALTSNASLNINDQSAGNFIIADESGLAVHYAAGAFGFILGANTAVFPRNDRCTIAVLRKSRDTTARASAVCGYNNGANDRVLLTAPFSDGNAYFDFGNATGGSGRVSAAFTKRVQYETLVCTAGPRTGRAIWRNRERIASGAGAATIGYGSGYSSNFRVGGPQSGVAADNENISMLLVSSEEWSEGLIRGFGENPWQFFQPIRRRIYSFPSGVPYVADATVASLLLDTFQAEVKTDTDIAANTAALELDAKPAAVTADTNIPAALAQLELDAKPAAVTADTDIQANTAALEIDTQPASLVIDTTIAAAYKQLLLSVHPSAVTIGATIEADAASLLIDAMPSTITTDTAITASIAALVLQSQTADISIGTTVSAGVISLLLDTHQAAILQDVDISATTANLVIDALQAAVTAGTTINAQVADLILDGKAATITAAFNLAAGTASLALDPKPATVAVALEVDTNLAQLVLTTAPVNIIADFTLPTTSASLALTAYISAVTLTERAITAKVVIVPRRDDLMIPGKLAALNNPAAESIAIPGRTESSFTVPRIVDTFVVPKTPGDFTVH